MRVITKVLFGQRLAVVSLAAIAIAGVAAYNYRPVVHAQDDLTPGMLFGPLWVDHNQHLEVCFSFLSPGITAFVHFRNMTTGEVTLPQSISINSGGGAARLTRAEAALSAWPAETEPLPTG
jgi:hypothetical protein